MTALSAMISRLKALESTAMAPGELPEKHFVACFDRATDSDGNELPIVRLQAGDTFWDRESGEGDDAFLDRALTGYCQGMALGTIPMLIAHRQKENQNGQ